MKPLTTEELNTRARKIAREHRDKDPFLILQNEAGQTVTQPANMELPPLGSGLWKAQIITRAEGEEVAVLFGPVSMIVPADAAPAEPAQLPNVDPYVRVEAMIEKMIERERKTSEDQRQRDADAFQREIERTRAYNQATLEVLTKAHERELDLARNGHKFILSAMKDIRGELHQPITPQLVSDDDDDGPLETLLAEALKNNMPAVQQILFNLLNRGGGTTNATNGNGNAEPPGPAPDGAHAPNDLHTDESLSGV